MTLPTVTAFRVEHIPKDIYRKQTYNSIMCGYFYIWFIDFMLKGKSLLDCTNLFSPNEYEKNDKIILELFQWLKRLRWTNIMRYLW